MPTEPSDALLHRASAKKRGAVETGKATALLRELVNYATVNLEQCVQKATAKENVDIAPFVLYLHVIEMMDGIEILLGECAPMPALPLLRSALEATISLEYILEDDSKYEERSLSWLVGRVHEDIAALERMDPSTNTGKQFQAVLAKDKLAAGLSMPPQAAIQKDIARQQSLLAEPDLAPIETEYVRCKTTEGRRPEWSHLFDGPRNIIGLAHHLNRGAQYELLYRPWSGVTHAQDFSRFLARAPGGGLQVKHLRDVGDVRYVIELAAPIILDVITMISKKFLPPSDQHREWFIREVAPLYNRL